MSEVIHKENLDNARAASKNNSEKRETNQALKTANNLRKLAKNPRQIFSLLKYVNWMIDTPIMFIALTTAILKDIFDLFVIGFVLSPLFAIIIAGCLGLIGGWKKRSLGKKVGIILAGMIIEIIPILGILPIETMTVIAVFYLVLRDRKAEALIWEKVRRERQRQEEIIAQSQEAYA